MEQIYQKAGIQVITVSSVSGQGVAQIKMLLKDKISVFTGNSGVGKSSLLNCISPEFRQETGIISSKLGRGKHTTRQVELLKLPWRRLCCRYTRFFHYGYGALQHCKKNISATLLQRDETLYYAV